mgnify:CR=1 FL=1
MNEYFPGKLTLTMESEETKELWLSFPDSEGSIPELAAGGSSFYTWTGSRVKRFGDCLERFTALERMENRSGWRWIPGR